MLLDPCSSRENKNRYVFGYCGLLVKCGLFKEVNVHFLPVGHTHEDIDQLFSRIAVLLKSLCVFCVDEMHAAVKRSYSGIKYCFHLDQH